MILLPFIVRSRALFVSRDTFKLYFYRGFFSFCAAASWFYFLQYVDLTALTAVGFMTPLFTVLLAFLFLGESFSLTKTTMLLIGFSGAMVVIRPFDIEFNVYLFMAIGSAFLWAVSLFFAKQLSRTEPALSIVFYFAAIITPFAMVLAIPVWQWPSLEQWIYILLFVFLATIGQFAIAKAFKYADLVTLMPLGYCELIFAGIFSYFVFGDIVTIYTLLGGAIILASSYMTIKKGDSCNK